MVKPQLIALDLDGTLLDEQSCLSDIHIRAIRHLQTMNVKIIIATGRPLITTKPFWHKLKLDTPCISFNGAWISMPDDEIVKTESLSELDVFKLLQILKNIDGAISLYDEFGNWVMSSDDKYTKDWDKRYDVPILIDEEKILSWEMVSPKLMFVSSPENIIKTYKILKASFDEVLSISISQPDRIEILQKNTTKGTALEKVASMLSVPQEAVWAVGDAENDLDMIKWAGVGCCMGQSVPKLKNYAKHILPTIDNYGLSVLPELINSYDTWA